MHYVPAGKIGYGLAMQTRLRVVSGLLLSSAALLLAPSPLACGGGGDAKAPTSGSTAPGTDGAGAASGSDGPGGPGGTGAGGAGTMTTTTALPDGGELQGAKLGSSTHIEVETKGDGGPKVGPGHQQEPGRKREDIQTIIMARRDEARACYDKSLKDHPGIEGDLDIKWVIDKEGSVTDASVDSSKSTIHEPSVGTCIIEIIKKIKFAPSKGGYETRAHYPFNFHPRQGGGKDAGK